MQNVRLAATRAPGPNGVMGKLSWLSDIACWRQVSPIPSSVISAIAAAAFRGENAEWRSASTPARSLLGLACCRMRRRRDRVAFSLVIYDEAFCRSVPSAEASGVQLSEQVGDEEPSSQTGGHAEAGSGDWSLGAKIAV